ncbi:MAG: D-aminoacyl-tRNA deacylase [Actinomycetota bacterium]|nr:D-aminoacyl-tRNA deacylase [Actinomycetota bacterium]
MRMVLQRVLRASVSVENELVGEIGHGLLLLVAAGAVDGPDEPEWLARKIAGLRVFADDDGKMNRSVVDVGGAALVVSQFTLYGDVSRGRRPSWTGAADPDMARERIEEFARRLEAEGVPVASGRFGAHMDVELVNDGPVTLILDSAEL